MEKNKLLQISTQDGLYLHGYYLPSENKKVGLLHIHGFEGNFYENDFIYKLATEMEEKSIGFLTANNRGNGKDTGFNTVSGEYRRIGAWYELLEEAHFDISAWLRYLIGEGYESIVLMGHSLGTMKAIRYLFEGEYKEKINKLVLLSPFDKKGFMTSIGRGNIESLLNKAQKIIDDGKGDELISPEFEEGVMSYKTFISWYKQDDFGRMFEFCNKNYDFPVLRKIKIPAKIIVGSKDEYFHLSNPEHPEEAMKLLLDNIPCAKGKIIDGAVHSFKPCENIMVKEVSKFILEGE
jgi:pimeloyl-ACP methyl ester carboxylesterase